MAIVSNAIYHGISITSLLLVGLGLYVLALVIQYFRDPLRKVPGPAAARFTRLWYVRRLYKGDFHSQNVELHRKYGKVFRTAPNEYSIDDLDAAKVLYGHGTKFTKGNWYLGAALPSTLDFNLFSLQDPKQHAAVRRESASLYTMSALVAYEEYVNECGAIFCQRLEEFAAVGGIMNMGHWLQCYAFDTITKITFGRRFGFLEQGADIGGVIALLETFLVYGTIMGMFHRVHFFLSRFVRPTIGYVFETAERAVRQCELLIGEGKELPKTPDFITKMFAANARDPEKVSRDIVLGVAAGNVGAGSDTTAIGLSAIFYYLIENPPALAKLREELRVAEEAGTVSDPIAFAEAQRLPYFQAVIKESMRLHAPVALPLWRVVPTGGAMIAGQFFPAGAVVGINPSVAHHNIDAFGPDVDAFRPERWIEASFEQAAIMERSWMPFGLGSRTCIGKNISLLEISKIVPQLVRNFDFEREGNDVRSVNRFFVKMRGFDVRVKRRGNSKA